MCKTFELASAPQKELSKRILCFHVRTKGAGAAKGGMLKGGMLELKIKREED
jgi:hypothetical protein